MSSKKTPAASRPAATVMVIRDGAAGLEVFMVRRHHKIDFFSGALVFPGGKTDPQDEDPRIPPLADGLDDDYSLYQIAAVREAFEECGVLLARREGETSLVSGPEVAKLDPWRDRIHKGDTTLYDFLVGQGLRIACDQLVRFAHWITPIMSPKRFDTQFFLAPAPVDQLLVHDGHESVDSVWTTVDAAAKSAADGTYTIIFPTMCNLQKLGASTSVEEALEKARAAPIVAVLPHAEKTDEGAFLVIPEEAGYPVSRERLPEQMA